MQSRVTKEDEPPTIFGTSCSALAGLLESRIDTASSLDAAATSALELLAAIGEQNEAPFAPVEAPLTRLATTPRPACANHSRVTKVHEPSPFPALPHSSPPVF